MKHVDIHTHKIPSEGIAIYNTEIGGIKENILQDADKLFSAGIHPWHAAEATDEIFEQLVQCATRKEVVMIGECGLDKHSSATSGLQAMVFERQVQLSEKMCKPLIIHCVGCFNELFEIRKKLQPRQLWIIHGFRGKPELARQVLKSGCALSFGEHFNPESVRVTPTEKLFAETDESNLPIEEIYKRIAEAKMCSAQDLNAGELLLNSLLKQSEV